MDRKNKSRTLEAVTLAFLLLLSSYVIVNYNIISGFATSNGEVRIIVSERPAPPPLSGDGSGPSVVKKDVIFRLEPSIINIEMQPKTVSQGSFTIINEGLEPVKFFINIYGVEDYVQLLSTVVTINYKSQYTVPFLVTVKKAGTYSGRISVSVDDQTKSIPVIIEAQTRRSNYDVDVSMSPTDKYVYQNDDVTASITITKTSGDSSNVDLVYSVTDLNGKLVAEEIEVRNIPRSVTYRKTVDLPDELPIQEYVYSLELVDGSDSSVDSEMFDVVKRLALLERPFEILGPNINLLLLLLLIILLIISRMMYEKHREKSR